MEMEATLKSLVPYKEISRSVAKVIDSLEDVVKVTKGLEISDALDTAIINRVDQIEGAYLEHLRCYSDIIQELPYIQKTNVELAFAVEVRRRKHHS